MGCVGTTSLGSNWTRFGEVWISEGGGFPAVVVATPGGVAIALLCEERRLSEAHEGQAGGDRGEQVVADLLDENARRVVVLENRNQRHTGVVGEIVEP